MSGVRMLAAIVAIFALCALGSASAAAAEFTYSSTGELEGHATANQVFTTNGGTVTCTKAATAGNINKTTFTEQTVQVKYEGCTAFGFAEVHISSGKYNFTSNGTVHFLEPITITPTIFGTSLCTVTVGKQSRTSVGFANAGTSNITVTPNVSGIEYTSTGGSCGSSGSNGTYTGTNEINRKGGGTIRFDP